MTESFDIKVSIQEKLKKGLIFGFKARLPIAVLLQFLGYRHEVMPLLQRISHGTRAYIINADSLLGFVMELNIINLLKEADKNGLHEHLKKWQELDLMQLSGELGG